MPTNTREPIRIDIGKQSDGCVFMLYPLSKERLSKEYPDIHPASSIFISFETQKDFENQHGLIWNQIITLLTGLSPAKLKRLGGVSFYDPATDREVKRV